MSIAFKIEQEFDEHTPKISYSEIPKSEKSLKLCPKIVLWGVQYIKDFHITKHFSKLIDKC
jgi:hypothetical protein